MGEIQLFSLSLSIARKHYNLTEGKYEVTRKSRYFMKELYTTYNPDNSVLIFLLFYLTFFLGFSLGKLLMKTKTI